MRQAFTSQLGLKVWKTNVKAQKFDSTTPKTYEIKVFIFSVSDKNERERFFPKSFLLVDVKPNIVLGISFLAINNANVDFQAWNSK